MPAWVLGWLGSSGWVEDGRRQLDCLTARQQERLHGKFHIKHNRHAHT